MKTDAQLIREARDDPLAQAALSLRRFRDRAAGSASPCLYGIVKNRLQRYAEHERVETQARERIGVPVGFDDDLDRIDESDRAVRLRPALASALATMPPTRSEAVTFSVQARTFAQNFLPASGNLS